MSESEGIGKWLESVRGRDRNREEGEAQLIFGETSQMLLGKGGRRGISFTFSMLTKGVVLSHPLLS